MRTLVLVIGFLAALMPGIALAQGSWFEWFDGTMPSMMVSTGDPADTGAFTVQDEDFLHSAAGSAHYVYLWLDAWFMPLDAYEFRVWGAPWDFAWRIGVEDPSSGRCLRLSHTDRHGQWAYVLSEFEWSVPGSDGGRPCEWTWHRGTDVSISLFPTDGPAEGWHDIFVIDMWSRDSLRVKVDNELVFAKRYERIGFNGYTGFGCEDVGAGAPSWDYFAFWWPSPVEPVSWGKMKAMYRE